MNWREKLGTAIGVSLAVAIPVTGGLGVSYAVNAMPIESSAEIPINSDEVSQSPLKEPGQELGEALRSFYPGL